MSAATHPGCPAVPAWREVISTQTEDPLAGCHTKRGDRPRSSGATSVRVTSVRRRLLAAEETHTMTTDSVDRAAELEAFLDREATNETAAVETLRELADEMASVLRWQPHLLRWGGDFPGDGIVARLYEQLHDAGVDVPRRVHLTAGDYRPPVPPQQSKYKRKPLGTRRSLAVFARDNFTCQNCGTKTDLTVDHIVPVSKGGTNDDENLRTLCGSCNSRKGDR